MIKLDKKKTVRINQGDIYRDIEYIENVDIINDEIKIIKIVFPLVIVLTQDCDLQQDSEYRIDDIESPNNDNRKLFSIIVAPLYNEEMFLAGEHLNDNETIIMKMTGIPKYGKKKKITTQYNNLVKNEIPRYHHLAFPDDIDIVDSVIDFKHYFTINIDNLMKIKDERFVGKVSELYREDISIRFANFLSRIGLPN